MNGKLVTATLLAVGLGTGGGLALAGVSIPGLGSNVAVPPEKAAALQRLVSVATTDSSTQPAPEPGSEPQPIPGRILGTNVPVPISPSILRPRNGWLVSDGKTLVAVYAGAAGSDASLGRVVIVRQDLVAGRQTIRVVDTGPTGALTIADAPVGASVETSAQTGDVQLETAGGRVLVLDLGDGAVGK